MSLPYWLPSVIAALAILGASWVLMALAWRDLTLRRLPNTWVGAYAALFFLYAWVSGMGWVQLGWHAAIGLAVTILMVGLFALRIVGGGDVKLWGALMLWAGPQGAVAAVVIATVCGTLLGILGWVSQQILKRNRKPVGAPVFKMLSAARGVPYGVGLALAGLQNVWVTLL
ncbi:prepilin peptidase [Alcaligenaceae bacterium]|nr:prepilin peptidase [Alcaligenaceae bacterium]